MSTSRSNVLSATIYLANMQEFAATNVIWDAWFPADTGPTRTCVEARLARPAVLIENTVVAATSS